MWKIVLIVGLIIYSSVSLIMQLCSIGVQAIFIPSDWEMYGKCTNMALLLAHPALPHCQEWGVQVLDCGISLIAWPCNVLVESTVPSGPKYQFSHKICISSFCFVSFASFHCEYQTLFSFSFFQAVVFTFIIEVWELPLELHFFHISQTKFRQWFMQKLSCTSQLSWSMWYYLRYSTYRFIDIYWQFYHLIDVTEPWLRKLFIFFHKLFIGFRCYNKTCLSNDPIMVHQITLELGGTFYIRAILDIWQPAPFKTGAKDIVHS